MDTSIEADLNLQLGRKLRALREAQGLTSLALAKALGISHDALLAQERAEHPIGAGDLLYWSRALGVSVDTVFEGLAPSVSSASPNNRARAWREQLELAALVGALPEALRLRLHLLIMALVSAEPQRAPTPEPAHQIGQT